MFNGRIKGAHVPRFILAVVALLLFFATLFLEWINQSVDFSQPLWGVIMLGFLLVGIGMLVASWIVGFDSSGELVITLVMIAAHVGFDGYMLVYVKFLHNPVPIPLVQAVIQGYWVAGLLDVLLMFWADNMHRLSANYVSPEKALQIELDKIRTEAAQARQELAVLATTYEQEKKALQATSEGVIKVLEARLEDTQRQVAARDQQIASMVAEANRVYEATCEHCGRTFEGKTQQSADAKRNGHRGQCKALPVTISGNGHNHAAVEVVR